MSQLTPPVAPRVPHERTHHGDTFIDEYEWLRAKEDPETVAYLEAENAYAAQQTAHLEPLRQAIFDEIKSRTQETDLSVPARKGEWWYYGRTIEGQQYALHCRCPAGSPDDWTPPELDASVEVPGEQLLIDGNLEAEGHEFFSLGTLSVSPDGNLLAWSVDVTGGERYLMRFKDLRTGEVLPDEVPNTYPSTAWLGDGASIFYLTVDDAWRPDRVWKHVLGTSSDATSWSTRNPTPASWWESEARAATATSRSGSPRRSPPRSASWTRRTLTPASASWPPAARASSTPSTTPSSPARTVS
jgi:oligopeptidase B